MITRNSSQKYTLTGSLQHKIAPFGKLKGLLLNACSPLVRGEQNALLRGFPAVRLQTPGAERRDGRACATLAICQFLRDSQFPFRTYRHQSQCFNPAGDHAVNREFSWLAASNGAVKHGAVDQFSGVMNTNAVGTCRNCAFARLITRNCRPDSVLFTPSFGVFFRYFTPSAAIARKR